MGSPNPFLSSSPSPTLHQTQPLPGHSRCCCRLHALGFLLFGSAATTTLKSFQLLKRFLQGKGGLKGGWRKVGGNKPPTPQLMGDFFRWLVWLMLVYYQKQNHGFGLLAILKQEKQKDPHLQHLAAAVFCCFFGGRGLYRKDRIVSWCLPKWWHFLVLPRNWVQTSMVFTQIWRASNWLGEWLV